MGGAPPGGSAAPKARQALGSFAHDWLTRAWRVVVAIGSWGWRMRSRRQRRGKCSSAYREQKESLPGFICGAMIFFGFQAVGHRRFFPLHVWRHLQRARSGPPILLSASFPPSRYWLSFLTPTVLKLPTPKELKFLLNRKGQCLESLNMQETKGFVFSQCL